MGIVSNEFWKDFIYKIHPFASLARDVFFKGISLVRLKAIQFFDENGGKSNYREFLLKGGFFYGDNSYSVERRPTPVVKWKVKVKKVLLFRSFNFFNLKYIEVGFMDYD